MSDDAASSVFAVMIASVVVLGAFTFVLFETEGSVHSEAPSVASTNLDSQAQNLAYLLVSSPGFGAGGVDWTAAPDSVARLGLRAAGTGHDVLLDYDKFDNLRLANATDPAGTDGRVNYPEAKASLGLSGVDFHIRAYPNLKSVEEILDEGYRDPNLKVAYVGNWLARQDDPNAGPPAGLVVRDLKCGRSPLDSGVMRLNATIENGGTTTTQFLAVFDATIDGKSERREDVTYLVAPNGGTGEIRADFVGDTKWSCDKVSTVEVEVYDPSQLKIGEYLLGAPTITAPVTAKAPDVLLRGGNANIYVPDSKAAILSYEGPKNTDVVSAWVYSGASVVWSLTNVKPKDVGYDLSVPADRLGPGQYEARMTFGGATVAQRILVVPDASPPLGYAAPSGPAPSPGWHSSAATETGMIATLIDTFCPYEHDSSEQSPLSSPPAWAARCPFKPDAVTGEPGDVYPDVRGKLQSGLAKRLVYQNGPQQGSANLESTNVLVVGSGVDHQPMVHIKSEVATWVAAGGTLIVFGSKDTNTQWMQSIFHLGIESSNNGITVNDASHPLLHVPDDLSYQDYDNRGQSWKFTGNSQSLFTQVVNEADQDSTILSVSDAGVFGKGSVIVTSWFPYDLFNDSGGEASHFEGHLFVNNLLMLGYRTLYLDYGPPIPAGAAVIGDTSKAAITHPQLGRVTLDLVVYLFPEG